MLRYMSITSSVITRIAKLRRPDPKHAVNCSSRPGANWDDVTWLASSPAASTFSEAAVWYTATCTPCPHAVNSKQIITRMCQHERGAGTSPRARVISGKHHGSCVMVTRLTRLCLRFGCSVSVSFISRVLLSSIVTSGSGDKLTIFGKSSTADMFAKIKPDQRGASGHPAFGSQQTSGKRGNKISFPQPPNCPPDTL